jgi:hypothetical protein
MLSTADLSSLYNPGMDLAENISSVFACSLRAEETCRQGCSLATAALLSLITQPLLSNEFAYQYFYIMPFYS